MKRKIITAVIALVLFLSAPAALCAVGFGLPAQFDETYFGQLPRMVKRLNETEGRKLIFIGNSALAFGLRTDLVQSEVQGFTAVNFGLYGAIGTKAMMQLAKPKISAGDVVIIAPEQSAQSLSLYFSARNFWLAADGSFDMLLRVDKGDRSALAGNFPAFAAGKFKYFLSGSKPKTDGVYARSSFDDESGGDAGYMTFERAYNMMAGGIDANNPVSYSLELIGGGFIDYVNDYYEYAAKKGAAVYYGFAPANRAALKQGEDEKSAEIFYDYLNENLNCAVLGNPTDYLFDYEYFYDSNAHLNSAGAYHYTYRITEDLKAALGDSSPTDITQPEKPIIPPDIGGEGEDKDADCFIYSERGQDVEITALSDKGKERTALTVPHRYNGKPVTSFSADTFAGNAKITSLTLSENLRILYDDSFEGCGALKELIITQQNPNRCGVGTGLLKGAPNCYIFVPENALDLYATHYNWGGYSDKLRPYAK